jgi:glycosyltransferase involved in cell wall biosynthesis
MKTLRFFIIAAGSFLSFAVSAQTGREEQEKLNLPGDNLNLYAVLKLFQESKTLEGFERSLNDSTTKINNLDLDGDNKIDYIRVVDKPDGDVHNITLKDAISKTEDQDVAVFVVQKKSNGQADIQLIGDEDLYGKDYIIEPNMDVATTASETPNPGYTPVATLANGETVPIQTTTEYEIATWPVVQYIYVPTYTVWVSPWSWDYYPDYWRPWRPHYWHYYYGYQFNYQPYYYGHYRRWNSYRVPGWYGHYYGGNYRSRSPFVQRRYQEGYYRRTYGRPESARNGANAFRRDNPKETAVHTLPGFDNSGHPVPVRTPGANQGIRPVKTNPAVTEPGIRPVKPVREPGIKPTQPAVSDEQPVKPIRPIKEPGVRPVKPVTPVTQEPGIKPVRPVRPVPTDQPGPKPVRPTREPGIKPVRPTQEIRPMQEPRQQPIRREPAPVKQNPVRREKGN